MFRVQKNTGAPEGSLDYSTMCYYPSRFRHPSVLRRETFYRRGVVVPIE